MKSFIVAGAVLSLLQVAQCCAIVGPEMQRDMSVELTSESALIVWDEKTKTEHFIRSANFSGEAKNFGFIVPTPSKPSLGETKSGLFEELEEGIKPEIVTKAVRNYQWSLLASCRGGGAKESVAGSPSMITTSVDESVEVIEQTKVGAYEATVLRADDAQALGAWLRKNSYSAPPSVEKWLQFYTAKKWYLTAFKVSAEGQQQNTLLSPVRISFKTEQPFYPYHEPEIASKADGGRSLRVFFVGDKRVEANIVAPEKSEKWQVSMPFSSALKNSVSVADLSGVPSDSVNNLRLTTFEDFSSPRRGFGDLYFSSSTNQSNVVPEPIIKEEEQDILIPLDLIVFVALIVVLMATQRRPKKSE